MKVKTEEKKQTNGIKNTISHHKLQSSKIRLDRINVEESIDLRDSFLANRKQKSSKSSVAKRKSRKSEVILDRLSLASKVDKQKAALWACLACFEFSQGACDSVRVFSEAHVCDFKESNLPNFAKFVVDLSKKNVTTFVKPVSTSAVLPPPPPPPFPSKSIFEEDQSKLTWNELKALKTKRYAVVEAKAETPKKKHVLKTAPAMSNDPKGFIASQNKLNEQLAQIFASGNLGLTPVKQRRLAKPPQDNKCELEEFYKNLKAKQKKM